ncbi:dephospho-CoA kinase [Mesoplasma lactucae]|uniref:Uncharacterized protein n=1 Tax=Mesoplasma lactucae ATCC 49193 TaxID=81460 RepID=A0A291IRM1_9MOLU|nr:dephospho-CoA kinase [Mesoplasma lactucae]ATG97384.1 hypothetical protein CP520_01250 [Mesoplasma lactucae ATCC 49193]ATZ20163.1 dephospho-CoA kinase [Mesoplasma lactucae ATCC 49193]MCL8216912.1 Dephospho-CoA kinase [Mesoplasma lactucae ATCC 49193]
MIIGIFGNIGSGKSTVAKYIANNYNFSYLNLDEVAKVVMSNNIDLQYDLFKLKQDGIDVLDNNNEIDHEKMTEVIFTSQKKNKKVSQVIWKYLKKEVNQVLKILSEANVNVVVEGACLPSIGIKSIDVQLYLANPEIDSFLYSNKWKRKIAKEKNKTLKEINKVISIQNNYNLHQRIDYVLENDPLTMNVEVLNNKVNEFMKLIIK